MQYENVISVNSSEHCGKERLRPAKHTLNKICEEEGVVSPWNPATIMKSWFGGLVDRREVWFDGS